MSHQCQHQKIYNSGVSVNSAHYDPKTEILWIEARCLPFIEEDDIKYALVHKKHFDAIHAAIHAGDEPAERVEKVEECCGSCAKLKECIYTHGDEDYCHEYIRLEKSAEKVEECCESCLYGRNWGEPSRSTDLGNCLKKLPNTVGVHSNRWPVVYKHEWCGEYRPKE